VFLVTPVMDLYRFDPNFLSTSSEETQKFMLLDIKSSIVGCSRKVIIVVLKNDDTPLLNISLNTQKIKHAPDLILFKTNVATLNTLELQTTWFKGHTYGTCNRS